MVHITSDQNMSLFTRNGSNRELFVVHHSPAFETAATRVGSEIQLIPGRTMGYLHLKSDVIRVCIDDAVDAMVGCWV